MGSEKKGNREGRRQGVFSLYSKIMGSLKKRLKTHKGYNVKFLIDNWMLISIAVAAGGMLIWPMVSGAMNAGALTASGAVQLINREKAVV
jgi:hypothetical protein